MPAPLSYLNNPACIEALLAKWPEDERYYRVSLISCDEKNNRSLVKFEDGQSYPIENKELHLQVDLEKIKDENIMCCLCEQGKSEPPNLITICDLCQLGYHVGCHNPPIDPAYLEDDEKEWFCETCLEITNPDRRRQSKGNSKKRKTLSEEETKVEVNTLHNNNNISDNNSTKNDNNRTISENNNTGSQGANNQAPTPKPRPKPVVEKMDPIVINAAKALSEPMETQDFVAMIESVQPKLATAEKHKSKDDARIAKGILKTTKKVKKVKLTLPKKETIHDKPVDGIVKPEPA